MRWLTTIVVFITGFAVGWTTNSLTSLGEGTTKQISLPIEISDGTGLISGDAAEVGRAEEKEGRPGGGLPEPLVESADSETEGVAIIKPILPKHTSFTGEEDANGKSDQEVALEREGQSDDNVESDIQTGESEEERDKVGEDPPEETLEKSDEVSESEIAFATLVLEEEDLKKVGQRIWKSECNGTIEGLTSWNSGEEFASVGIGHFIWFPKDVDAIFDESFPTLLDFYADRGETDQIPGWIHAGEENDSRWVDCPWNTKAEFDAAFSESPMVELRGFLANSIAMQAEFLLARFNASCATIIGNAGESRETIQGRFEGLSSIPEGAFAMIDYVNFKGEGTKETERYNGEGWGLLQVLENMRESEIDSNGIVAAFSESAERTLTRRTENNPPDKKWLKGWTNRVRAYKNQF